MNQGIYSLSATMINQLNRVDVISNNLANVNTVGFKGDNLIEGSFNNYLQKAKENKIPATPINTITNTVPKIDGSFTNGTIGAFTETNNQLDFALNANDTFFKIKDNNGNILLTRDGSFKSLNGELVTSEGYKVLNANNEPIAVEDGFEQELSIVKANYKDMHKVGSNNYQHRDNKQLITVDDQTNQIIQGSIEKSNINAVSTMVALIDAQRRLEQAQKAINGIDDINSKLLTKIDGR